MPDSAASAPKGDAALFGGHTTQAMKDKFGITQTRPLADFLPTLTIAAKNLATEMTNHNVQQADLHGEPADHPRACPEQHQRSRDARPARHQTGNTCRRRKISKNSNAA